jgi:hypothetical protein
LVHEPGRECSRTPGFGVFGVSRLGRRVGDDSFLMKNRSDNSGAEPPVAVH